MFPPRIPALQVSPEGRDCALRVPCSGRAYHVMPPFLFAPTPYTPLPRRALFPRGARSRPPGSRESLLLKEPSLPLPRGPRPHPPTRRPPETIPSGLSSFPIMAELPFWDEECLRGSIDHAPLPPPPRSLFESDLFCNEDVENDPLPPHLPSNDFLFAPNDAFASPARVLLSPSRFLSAGTPPLIPHPAPLAVSPIRPLAESPARPGWRSFLDDNCPLRKRVKVTITPAARARRSLGLSSPEPPAKKPRLSSPPQPRDQIQPSAPRRRQTTLRLPRSGEQSGRITLHVPSTHFGPPSPQSNPGSSSKQTSARSKLTNSNSNNATDLTAENKHPDSRLELEVDPTDQSRQDDELDLEADLEQGFDPDCGKLEDNCSFGENLEKAIEALPLEAPVARAIPVGNNARVRANKCRDYITTDLSQRLISMSRNAAMNPVSGQDSGLMVPLVDAAVQAVTRAAQRYSSLVTKVSSSPPAFVLADAWRAPNMPVSGQKQGSRARNTQSSKAGKMATKRKRSRRRRTLLSFDDHDVTPLKDSRQGMERDETKNGQLDETTSALARYLNSPTSSRTETLAC